jgi:DNA-binding NarL/FixJ family response regulator
VASVLIVDDQPLIHLGLQQVLSQEFRGLVFGRAKSGDEAAVRLSRQPWDLVILGIAIPGDEGFCVFEEIRRLHPAARVLVLSGYADPKSVLRARREGASGYLLKSAGRAELLRAVESIFAGKDHFPPLRSADAAEETEPRHSKLSAREYDVMLAFVAGKRPGEIAAELNLSVKTISTYKRRLMHKLGLRSMSDLVRYAIDNQLS